MPYHIKNKQSYSKNAILVGDPKRAEFIAKNFLKNSKLINSNRGLLAYNGKYKNQLVSIQTTGMGCPSTAIVMEELIDLKVEKFLRLGTTCSLKNKKKETLIIVKQAFSSSSTHGGYSVNKNYNYYPNKKFLKLAMQTAKNKDIGVGLEKIATVDSFYNKNILSNIKKWQKLKLGSIDMETSIIFDIANNYKKKALAILTPVESLILENKKLTHSVNSDNVNKLLINEMILLGLEIISHKKL